jgi:hypothetical protein
MIEKTGNITERSMTYMPPFKENSRRRPSKQKRASRALPEKVVTSIWNSGMNATSTAALNGVSIYTVRRIWRGDVYAELTSTLKPRGQS